MAIVAFSNFTITLSDGGTVPSIDYLTKKTYVNIGSGNILRVSWNTPTAANNAVDSYKIYILKYDFASDDYESLYTSNIGNVNEFYLKSSLFASVPQSFVSLRVYVEAISKYGTAYNCISNIEAVDISKGCGTYVKVEDGYSQPVMKRALAFTKLNYVQLTDAEGKVLKDAEGKILYAKAVRTQDLDVGWSLMQEFFAKDHQSAWQTSDVRYEVLTDENGELILDSNNNPIYIL